MKRSERHCLVMAPNVRLQARAACSASLCKPLLGVAIAEPAFSQLPPTSLPVTIEKLCEHPNKRGKNTGIDGDSIPVKGAVTRRRYRINVIPFLNQRAVPVITKRKRR